MPPSPFFDLSQTPPSSSRHKANLPIEERSPLASTHRSHRGALSQRSSQIWTLSSSDPHTHQIFFFWIYHICYGWVVNFLCDLLWIVRIFLWIVVLGFIFDAWRVVCGGFLFQWVTGCCLGFYSKWVAGWFAGGWWVAAVGLQWLSPIYTLLGFFFLFFIFCLIFLVKGFVGLFVLELYLFLIYINGFVVAADLMFPVFYFILFYFIFYVTPNTVKHFLKHFLECNQTPKRNYFP